MTIDRIAENIRGGERVSAGDALALYRDAPTPLLGRLADEIRERKHGEGVVTYIIDRNVNYTNVCVAKCNFCAFYRPVGSPEGYVLGFDELFRKIDETIALGGGQVLLQGGHNPDLPLTWYEDLFRAIKARYPRFRLHALSPPEIIHLSRLSQLRVPQVIARLIDAGLDSVPGGGAEILVDRVRKLLHCDGKATADDVTALQTARDAGLNQSDAIAREYFREAPEHRELGARYLRDNIKYYLGGDERAGLELFYRYAAEIGLAPTTGGLRFYP